MKGYSVIGKRFPRIDAPQKATGEAKYTADIVLPGILYGRILRSPLAHAKILNVDTSKAAKVPGVKAIITAKDIFRMEYGPVVQDERPLANDKVRYVGDEVAAVAAIDEDTAEEALDLIEVEYEELPAVFDPEEAMKPKAPKIHNVECNICHEISLNFGDVDKGFREADYVFEDRFATSPVQHCCMEPQICIASFNHSNQLTVWSSTSSPFYLCQALANYLNMPMSKIRIIKPHVGGSFGIRGEIFSLHFCCVLLSKKTGRPVKIEYTREEEFTATRMRHPLIIGLKTGVKKDGTIIAYQAKVITDNGAYTSYAPVVTLQAGAILASLYKVPNIKYNAYIVYTNKLPGGAFRGFGNPQITFAIESQMDIIAQKIGIDPLQIRLKNAVQSGDVSACGWKITSCGLSECLQKAMETGRLQKKQNKSSNCGVGMAAGMHHCGAKMPAGDSSSAFIEVWDDGSVFVLTGASDVGQGSDTILAQIVAEELGLRLEDINIKSGDTGTTPMDFGTYASRVTVIAGNAVRAAAIDAKQQILELAAEKLGANVGDLEFQDREIYVKKASEKRIAFSDAVKTNQHYGRGITVLGKGFYDSPAEMMNLETGYGNYSVNYPFMAYVAEVDVDTGTGQVKVLSLTAAYDAGDVINPLLLEGQIDGGISMGIGYALTEELIWKEGKIINPTFTEYKVPNTMNVPIVKRIMVKTHDPEGPFGAKGIAEATIVPVAPAIANAVYDAVGVRIKELPITPEKILKALALEERRR